MNNPTVAELGEHAIIRRITSRLSMPAWVEVGPGDDAAVIKPARGRREVLTTDTLVDGVHFDQAFVPAAAIGHRALAVNVSDLAAMGAEPHAALLALALPPATEVAALDAMIDGFLEQAAAHTLTLLGGNITRTPGPMVITVTAIGTIRPRQTLTRSGARPGDEVYVTGMLGDAATGLAMLRAMSTGMPAESSPPTNVDESDCIQRYLRPQPRVRAGTQLAHHGAASSCIDMSDGLADAVRQIAEASGVGITLEADALPLSPEARAWHQVTGTSVIDAALGGGDDYELLFTVRPRQRGRLRGARRRIGDLPITRIGVVTRTPGVLWRDASGTHELPPGFEHFR